MLSSNRYWKEIRRAYRRSHMQIIYVRSIIYNMQKNVLPSLRTKSGHRSISQGLVVAENRGNEKPTLWQLSFHRVETHVMDRRAPSIPWNSEQTKPEWTLTKYQGPRIRTRGPSGSRLFSDVQSSYHSAGQVLHVWAPRFCQKMGRYQKDHITLYVKQLLGKIHRW
jgi:hypothetical protein